MQRAVFIAVLSFVFFLATMVIYYLRANLLYFLLATAFLLIYLAMMVSIILQRKSVAEVFENGLRYKGRELTWDLIDGVANDGFVTVKKGKAFSLPGALDRRPDLVRHIRDHTKRA